MRTNKRMLACWLVLLIPFLGTSQINEWKIGQSTGKVFVENNGQFDSRENAITGKIRYAADLPHVFVMFGEKGISYQLRTLQKIGKHEREAVRDEVSNKQLPAHQKETMYSKSLLREDEISASWGAVSEALEVIPAGKRSSYHSYTVADPSGTKKVNYNHVREYATITYKNMYDGIDVLFEIHPESGVKYSITLHPGASPNDIRMVYDRDLTLLNGELVIPTLFGNMIDHAPVTFYADNTAEIITSRYTRVGNQVGFELGNYDDTRTVVIDPWVQMPNFNSDWDCVWELDHDANGNVYVIGGVDNMELLKYDPSGNLEWTHTTPYDTSEWLGTVGTDYLGNSYVTDGTHYMVQKISPSGALVWDNPNPTGPGVDMLTEFWSVIFNDDQSEVYIAGTGGGSGATNFYGRVYRMDTTSGNVLESVTPTGVGNISVIPPAIQELRATCLGEDGTMYYITMDSIGAIDGISGVCGANSSIPSVGHGIDWDYKWDDWRLNNTGVRVLRSYGNRIYIHAGNQIQKRSLVDFSLINSAPIPNGFFNTIPPFGGSHASNGGIDIDSCGTIYVGSTTGVYAFDTTLTQTNFYPTTFKVWDVQVTGTNTIVAVGGTGTSADAVRTGGIASINSGGCSYMTYNGAGQGCCNPGFTAPSNLCSDCGPIQLVPTNSGGTWSGNGVDMSGMFDPSTAGIGNHTVYYTLPCGIDSMMIQVDTCINTTLSICADAGGNLFVTAGVAPFGWFDGTSSAGTVSIWDENSCLDCGGAVQYGYCNAYNGCEDSLGNTLTNCAGTVYTWNVAPYEIGTFSAPPLTWPILVVDGSGDSLIYNSISEVPPCATGLEFLANNDIVLHPVPATDELYIKTDSDVIGYTIYDVFGRLLMNGKGSNVDIRKLATGTYHILIELSEGKRVKRFVKK